MKHNTYPDRSPGTKKEDFRRVGNDEEKKTTHMINWSGYYVGMDPGVASTILDQALTIQVTYGAVMLSFLGLYSAFSQSHSRVPRAFRLCD